MSEILAVENLYKSFGQCTVLKGIDMTVRQGDVVAVLGASGAGKTTLLRCLNFLEKADSGTVRFNNITYDCASLSAREACAVRRHTGFVFQQYNLFRHQSALENVMEGLVSVRGMSVTQAKDTALQTLARVGMTDHAHAYPHQLSGGQQQRVAIARALAAKPCILYFDEPTSALDPERTEEVLVVMRQLAAEGMTMLVVTHELGFARHAATKVLFMEHGSVLEYSDARSFFQQPVQERAKAFVRTLECATAHSLPDTDIPLQ